MIRYIRLSELMSGSADADRRVCRRAGEWVTLSQVRSDVAHNVGRLDQRLEPGARVLLACSDSYWFVVGMWASMHAGAHLVLPPNAQPGTLAEFRAGVALSIAGPAERDAPEHFVLEHGASAQELVPLAPRECRIDFFSSGSTGRPKCISKTLQQLEVEVQNLEAMWGTDMESGMVQSTVSHLHIYGLTFGVLWPIAAGRSFDTETYQIWETLIPQLGAEPIIVSSPAHLTRIPSGVELPVGTKPRAVLTAGAPLSWSAARHTFETFGCWPREIYGSTETGGIAFRMRTEEDPLWTPFNGIETRAAGGVLCIRSPYLSDDAWHDLDDLVVIETDQTFRLIGRADRIAKIEGKRVSLAEIEARVVALDDYSDAAAMVIGDQRAIIGVAAVLTESGRRRLKQLGAFRFSREANTRLRHHLEPTTLPKRWRFVDRIPVNGQGKRLNSEISTMLESSQPMQKTNPEIQVVRRDNDAIEIDMLVPRDLLYFKGHFPENPVLPGIVQLDWAISEVRRNFAQTGPVMQIQNLKFRRLIQPGTKVTLSLHRRSNHGRISFEFHCDDTLYSSGKFAFAEA